MRSYLLQHVCHHSKFTMAFARSTAAVGILSAAAAFSALAPLPAQAVPANGITCRITTYFKTVELEKEVGLRSTCPGVKKWGKTSKFFEVELIDTGHEGSGGHRGLGGLPCEFLASGCSNLPELRHQ